MTISNSRDAIGKILGAVREITKTLDSGLDEADMHAFAHYAVDLLEETAGAVLGVLPSREMALAEEDPRRAEIADQVELLLIARSEAHSAKDWSKADESRRTETDGCCGYGHTRRPIMEP